ncbi:hypothetical protein CLG94_09060 [Candidatus Methylomirabilis limnetica]|jgi:hypothetical protein|uniref:Uncharacterized protein n=1 Tax=Candidatus Methylomirabilis limnetica TaxID=2033718 RepID=A0A2T4TXS5_9BACT|nr:hypothetical protein [Candidatus Methylomirabilis limnetica]PTL35889.1 hypothetical protein CLG94_09060 [Candidatus Methylomirabilis limnetica]
MGIENIDLFPFVLSLSKHEQGFAGQAPICLLPDPSGKSSPIRSSMLKSLQVENEKSSDKFF